MLVRTLFIIGFCLLFWLICYLCTGNDKKNMSGFRTYPDEVQEIIRRDPELGKMAPEQINIVKVFGANLLTFTILFTCIGEILKRSIGFQDFADTFFFILIWGEVLNLFDLLIIDLLWWRNTKRIRFSCAPDKTLYQDSKKHIGSFVRGAIMYVIVAVISAEILMLV